MNYRHSFHAGNFSDVIKHVILVALLDAIAKKDKAYCYIDTHAGGGSYDLLSEQAQKTKEYVGGIEKVFLCDNPPPLVKRYIDAIHHINTQLTGEKFSSLRFYPGSPLIARYFARPKDRIIACELQAQEYQSLKNMFAHDKRVAIHHMDGFLGLKAFLPPDERRGLILIDPPYENPDEFARIVHSLPTALKRFNSGIYAIWYPIKEKKQVEQFYKLIKRDIEQPVLAVELTIYPDLANHLNGSGLIIINPPWQFDEMLAQILPWVWNCLTINKQGAFRAFMLK